MAITNQQAPQIGRAGFPIQPLLDRAQELPWSQSRNAGNAADPSQPPLAIRL